jgi:putative transposase
MKRKQFTEEQIVAILQEAASAPGAGRATARRHGITETTLYRWRAKYGGMQTSDVRRLRQLEDENARLKKLVADLSLDVAMLKDVAGRSW